MRTGFSKGLFVLLALLAGIRGGVCSAPAPTAQRLPTVDELVRRHIRETGGDARWRAIQTQRREGLALPDLGSLPLTVFAKAPGQWEFEITVAGGRIVRKGFDGRQGWEQDRSPRMVSSAQAFDEGIIYNPFWPLHFRQYFPKAAVKRIQRDAGGSVWVVEAFTPSGARRTLYFDAGSGLLTRAGNVAFSDYRLAGEVKVPFRVRFGWQTLQFTAIRHNAAMEDARFALPAPLSAAANLLPTSDEILDRYLAAIGGEAAMRVRSEVRKGTLNTGSQSFPVEAYSSAPDRWLFVVTLEPGRLEKQGFDGAVAWKDRAGFVQEMDSGDRKQLAGFLDLGLPVKLSEARKTMRVTGRETLGSKTVYVVEARLPGGTEQLAFDAQSGLLAQIGGVTLEDYRDVDGVKTAFLARNERGRTEIRFSEISRQAVDDALFRRPPLSAEFEKAFVGLTDARAVAVLPVLKETFGQGSTPVDGRLLYDLIREKGYRRALEVGAAAGYCSTWFALALRETGGRLTAIEIDPDAADLARESPPGSAFRRRRSARKRCVAGDSQAGGAVRFRVSRSGRSAQQETPRPAVCEDRAGRLADRARRR